MASSDIEKLLYSKIMDKKVIEFEKIQPPCRILQLLTVDDIQQLNRLATSNRYNSRPKEKYAMMNKIMERRGFKKLAAGTNRIVYKYMEDQSFIIKVAHCKVALTDNIQEMYNQNILAPFIAKAFDVTPCGTVGMFERVSPITNRQQFASISSDIYDIIINHFLGKYILDDFGSKFFMNWGVRNGAFPVLLDYPYVYKLDGAKLYCNKPDAYSETGYCGGEIDYDDGFNYLVCEKCGKSYFASDLKLMKDKSAQNLLIEKGDNIKMKVLVKKGNDIISEVDTSESTQIYEKTKSGKPVGYGLAKREKNRKPHMNVVVSGTSVPTDENVSHADTQSENIIPKTPNIDVVVRKGKRVMKSKESSQSFNVSVNYTSSEEEQPTSVPTPSINVQVETTPQNNEDLDTHIDNNSSELHDDVVASVIPHQNELNQQGVEEINNNTEELEKESDQDRYKRAQDMVEFILGDEPLDNDDELLDEY